MLLVICSHDCVCLFPLQGIVVKTGMQTYVTVISSSCSVTSALTELFFCLSSQMGAIATQMKTADKGQSPLQAKLEKLGTRLGTFSVLSSIACRIPLPACLWFWLVSSKGIASITVSVIVFVVGVTTGTVFILCVFTWFPKLTGRRYSSLCRAGRGADETSSQPVWLQMLMVAVSLTVAAVPVSHSPHFLFFP